ncbi:MAG: hypothetical protein JHC95_06935 [Solirubrobacteraceae bacterium]|nr:hypothetical protein [Solirubrobacteraceae bacterium]
MRRCILLVCAFAGVFSATAEAALPDGTRPVSRELRALGVSVTWPLRSAAAQVMPGTKLLVAVRQPSGRRTVRVALSEVDRTGRTSTVVGVARIKRGTVTLTVPRKFSATYALTLRVGARHYRSWVSTTKTATEAPAPDTLVPGASTLPEDPPSCPPVGTAVASLTLSAPVVPAGGTLGFTALNEGTTCLTGGAGYGLEQRVGEGWVDVTPSDPVPAIAYIVRPQASLSLTARIPQETVPGRYRLVVTLTPIATPLTAEFDVTG